MPDFDINLVIKGNRLEGQIKQVNTALGETEKRATRVRSVMGGLFAGFGVFQAVRSIYELSNATAVIENRLKLVEATVGDTSVAFDRLREISSRTRSPLEENVALFQRAAQAQKELGATSEQLFEFVEAVGISLAIQGGAAQTARGALIQLSQAIGATIVRAEEFNSILEGALPLAQAAARGIDAAGGSVARLRQLVIEGEVSSREFFEAIISQQESLRELYATTIPTLGQAFVVLRNEFIATFREFEQQTGIIELFARSIILLANNLDTLFTLVTAGAITAGILGIVAAFRNMEVVLAGLAAIMARIPVFLLAIVAVEIWQGLRTSAQAAEEFAESLKAVNDIKQVFDERFRDFLQGPMTPKGIEEFVETTKGDLDKLTTEMQKFQAELEAAQFWANAFGVQLFDTPRISAAQAEIQRLSLIILELETALSAAEHAYINLMGPPATLDGFEFLLEALTTTQQLGEVLKAVNIGPAKDLTEKYGEMADEARALLELNNKIAEIQAIGDFSNQIVPLVDFAKQLKVSKEELNEVFVSLNKIKEADTLQEQARHARELAERIIEMHGGFENLRGPALTLVTHLTRISGEALKAGNEFDSIRATLLGISVTAAQIWGRISRLASAFDGPLAAARQLLALMGSILGSISSLPGAFNAAAGNIRTIGGRVVSTLSNQVKDSTTVLGKLSETVKEVFTGKAGDTPGEIRSFIDDKLKPKGGSKGAGGGGGGSTESFADIVKAMEDVIKGYQLLGREGEIYRKQKEIEKQLNRELTASERSHIAALVERTAVAQKASEIYDHFNSRVQDYIDTQNALTELLKKNAITASQAAEALFNTQLNQDLRGVDLALGGRFAYEAQLDEIRNFANERTNILKAARDADLINEMEYQSRIKAAHQLFVRDWMALEVARWDMAIQSASSSIGMLLSFAEEHHGKQSGLYKKLFFAQKALAVAEATLNTFRAISNALAAPFPPPIPQILAAAAAVAGGAQVAAIMASQPPGAKDGGLIRGPGGPRGDKIPMMLSDKEFVVNARATAQHRDLLEAINSGIRLPRFADGGILSQVSQPLMTRRPDTNVDTARRSAPTQMPDLKPNVNVPVTALVVSSKEAALAALRTREGKTVVIEMIEEDPGKFRNLLSLEN